jgi:histidine ammonia-lyase
MNKETDMKVILDGKSLTIEQVEAVARGNTLVELGAGAAENVMTCRRAVEDLVAAGESIYGVTTGIGEFARIKVSPEFGTELQKRIVYSHAAGFGDPQQIDVVRAAMLLRANTLAKGYSAVRLSTLQTVIDMINRGVTPYVHEKGSVGTSGDLSPLSQVAEVVMGEGRAYFRGELLQGGEAMRLAGIEPVTLSFKEGLGIINGSQMCTGELALQVFDALRFVKNAMIASAMTIDALRSVSKAFDAMLHAVRPYPGQNAVARNIRVLTHGSEIIAQKSGKVQDGYSLRCTPQVIGPSLDAIAYVRKQVETEMNSASDNPLFFADKKIHLAGGNFHGQSIAIGADILKIAMAETANLSERHINRLLNPVLSSLPDFLVQGKGLNSGLMVAQYTAAALVSENKVLAHPGSVDSISVSADQEDHVSMAPVSVRTCKEIIKNVAGVYAIEMMCAAQAFDFWKPLKPGKGTAIAYDEIRKVVPMLIDDRVLYPDIEKITHLIHNDTIMNAVEREMGELLLFMNLE